MVRSLLVNDVRGDPAAARCSSTGGGLGHGVGLCQWGARGMAQTRRSVSDIAAHYFPGTVLLGVVAWTSTTRPIAAYDYDLPER